MSLRGRVKRAFGKLRRRYGHAKGDLRTIVLTWVEDDVGFSRGRLSAIKVGRASLWKARGTAADVVKAQALADKNNVNAGRVTHRVFTYPTTDRDWKKQGERDALKEAT